MKHSVLTFLLVPFYACNVEIGTLQIVAGILISILWRISELNEKKDSHLSTGKALYSGRPDQETSFWSDLHPGS